MNILKVLTGARLCRFVPSGQRTRDYAGFIAVCIYDYGESKAKETWDRLTTPNFPLAPVTGRH